MEFCLYFYSVLAGYLILFDAGIIGGLLLLLIAVITNSIRK
jgi:hypothetical protein